MNTLLSRKLKELAIQYGKEYLHTDPVEIPRRYSDPADREVAALVVSSLAYGNVTQIRNSAETVLAPMGRHPARFVRRTSARSLQSIYKGFVHRWTRGPDLASLIKVIGRILRRNTNLETFFLIGDDGDGDLVQAASSFSRRAISMEGPQPGKGFQWLLPNPNNGSAAKRLFLFLRWMVRPDDGVDMGVWTKVDKKRLVVPLDTHLFRIGWGLGMTDRRTPGIKAARDITRALVGVDPQDPVRFDFALARLGILDQCMGEPQPENLRACPLSQFCRHSAENPKAPQRAQSTEKKSNASNRQDAMASWRSNHV